jgi:DNA-directed RNA polymerase specialized sigma24 family protein
MSNHEELAHALDALRIAKRRGIRDPADLEDILQNAALRFVRAVARGVIVRSPFAFLLEAWSTEFALWLRSRRTTTRPGLRDPGELSHLLVDDSWESPTESRIRAAGNRLPEPLRTWFDDFLSGRSDVALAARDGVSEAAVRRRWRRLREHFDKPSTLADFLEMPLTNPAASASMRVDATDSPSIFEVPRTKVRAVDRPQSEACRSRARLAYRSSRCSACHESSPTASGHGRLGSKCTGERSIREIRTHPIPPRFAHGRFIASVGAVGLFEPPVKMRCPEPVLWSSLRHRPLRRCRWQSDDIDQARCEPAANARGHVVAGGWIESMLRRGGRNP